MKFIQDYIDNANDEEIVNDFTDYLMHATNNSEFRRIAIEGAIRELMVIMQAREIKRRITGKSR